MAENSPRFRGEALRLAQSIRWFGGAMAGAKVLVCFVDGVEDLAILHYHNRIDADGSLHPSPYPLAQARIKLWNERLRREREASPPPASVEDDRGAEGWARTAQVQK